MQLFAKTGAGTVETPPPLSPSSQKLSWILCILYLFCFVYIEATDYKTWESLLSPSPSPSPLPVTDDNDVVDNLSSSTVHIEQHHHHYYGGGGGGFGHILAPIITVLFIIETRNYDSLLKQVAVLLVLIEVTLWHYGYNAYANFTFIGLAIFLTIAGNKITTSNGCFDGDARVIFSAYEAEIRRIIRVKDPSKLGQVDSMLLKWKGREGALLNEVKARYMHSNNSIINNSINNSINKLDSAAKRKQSPGRAKDPSSSSSASTSSTFASKSASTITTDPLWAYLDDSHIYNNSSPPHIKSTNQNLVNNSNDQARGHNQDIIPHISDQTSSSLSSINNRGNSNINNINNSGNISSSGGSEFKKLYSNRLNFKDIVAKSTKITTATSLPINQLTSAHKALQLSIPASSPPQTSSIPPRNAR